MLQGTIEEPKTALVLLHYFNLHALLMLILIPNRTEKNKILIILIKKGKDHSCKKKQYNLDIQNQN